MKRVVVALFFILSVFAPSIGAEENCVGKSNPLYHPDYFNVCGGGPNPILKAPHVEYTPWLEGTSPFKGGEVCFDNFRLNRKGIQENLLPSDFTQWPRWDYLGADLGQPDDEHLTNIKWSRDSQHGKWYRGKEVAPNSTSAASLCVQLPEGKHNHAWPLKVPYNHFVGKDGEELEFSVWVRTTGPQVRIGFTLFDNSDSKKGNMIHINSRIIQDSTNGWVLLKVR